MALIKRHPIPRARVVHREKELLRLCTDKAVLHLGCADYPFTDQRGEDLLHLRLSRVARSLIGVDASIEGIEALKMMGFDELFLGDVESLSAVNLNGQFDVIVAGEILEHVANPGQFLSSVSQLMSEDTRLIITTPNAFSIKSVLHSLMQREKVHEDHNYWFSYRTVHQLLEKFQLSPSNTCYYQVIEGRGILRAIDWSLGRIPKVFPCLSDGLIVQAQLKISSDEFLAT